MKNFLWKLIGGPQVHGHRTVSPWKLGIWFLVGVFLVGWAVFNKAQLTVWFTPGESIKVNFASDYRLRPYFSQVKIAFVPVGMVTDVKEEADHSATVTLKLYGDARDKLGSEPSAIVRPSTLLGGNYFVDLIPGGDKGRFNSDLIPRERTQLPVELDHVIQSFQPDALAGVQGTVRKFDQTLAGGGREALQRLVADAPGALRPAGQVLDALRGTDPNRDLTNVVNGFEAIARELAEPKGRLDAIVTDLASLSATFGRRSGEFSATLDELPSALDSAEDGLERLGRTLDILEDTAEEVRPSAEELDDTLDRLDPVLARARPVVSDLREVLADARPLVERLVPVSQDATEVLDDLRGPVLDRVNGPITDLLLGTFQGSGPYAQTKTDKPIFQEIVHAATNLDRATMVDKNGSGIAFEAIPQPEPLENTVQNDGRPRTESLEHSVVDPLRVNPPVQAPGEPPHPNPGHPIELPLLGNQPAASTGEGR